MTSMTQALRQWKRGDGPLPGNLEQAALLVFDGPGWQWADLGAFAQSRRDEARLKVIAIIERFQQEAWGVSEAEASLSDAFARVLIGTRPVSADLAHQMTSYAEECLETLVTDAEFRRVAEASMKGAA